MAARRAAVRPTEFLDDAKKAWIVCLLRMLLEDCKQGFVLASFRLLVLFARTTEHVMEAVSRSFLETLFVVRAKVATRPIKEGPGLSSGVV